MNEKARTMDLNDIMQFDHVVQVTSGGVIKTRDVYAPEVFIDTDDGGQILPEHEAEMKRHVGRQGWKLLSGWSGQSHYGGPLMHPSEFIGGGLAEHIRETPGIYVALMVSALHDNEPVGWVIACRDLHDWEAELLTKTVIGRKFDEMVYNYSEGTNSEHCRHIGQNLYRFIRWMPSEGLEWRWPPNITVQRWVSTEEEYWGGYWKQERSFSPGE